MDSLVLRSCGLIAIRRLLDQEEQLLFYLNGVKAQMSSMDTF